MTWTDDRVEALKECWRKGHSLGQLAERLGKSRNAVKHYARRIGLKPRGRKGAWTNAEIDRLRTLHAAGKSYSQIALVLGRSAGAITGKADRLGLPRRDAANSDTKANRRKGRILRGNHKSPGAATLPRPAPPQVSATPPSDGAEPPHMKRVPFTALKPGQCKWPLWDDSCAHRDCCGEPVKGVGSWCENHFKRVSANG